MSASFGVAATDQGFGDVPSLVGAADAALYEAKNTGRNRVGKAVVRGAPLATTLIPRGS